jgi:hypothetical protein
MTRLMPDFELIETTRQSGRKKLAAREAFVLAADSRISQVTARGSKQSKTTTERA